MTYPGGSNDPQQPYQPPFGPPQPPQPPYGPPQPPYQPQYGQPPGYDQPPAFGAPPNVPWSTQPPAAGTPQRGGKIALIGIGGLLAVVVLVVGGYFAYQKVFVHTPTEVTKAYLAESTKPHPDRNKLIGMLCKEKADEARKEAANDDDTGSGSKVVEWHVTGENVNGDAATVYVTYTVKSGGKNRPDTLNVLLVKENRAWKICDFEQ